MATLVLRNSKGSPLTFSEVDANFTNLNNELAGKATSGSIVNADIAANAAITYSKLSLSNGILNADISASAAIAHSKLANITAGQVLLGNGSNVPTATALSGDVTVSSSGVTAIGAGVIVDADISASAAIAHSKLANITAGQVLLGNGSNVPTATALSGDVTVSSSGVTAIGAGVIVDADINSSAAIAASKIATNPTFSGQVTGSTLKAGSGVSCTVSPQNIELGQGASSGDTFIDLRADSTYTDYGLRIIRSPGANSGGSLACRGTGVLAIDVQDAGSIEMRTSGTRRLNINSGGGVGLHDKLDGAQGTMAARGYYGRAGYNASGFTNVWNIDWTGTPQLWIDSSNIGTFAFTSDYRAKKNIVNAPGNGIDMVKALRVVEFEFSANNGQYFGNLFRDDGKKHLGFVAHEVQQVHPSLAEGEKDEPNRVQNLRVDAMVALTVKALQEAVERIEALETQVAALTP